MWMLHSRSAGPLGLLHSGGLQRDLPGDAAGTGCGLIFSAFRKDNRDISVVYCMHYMHYTLHRRSAYYAVMRWRAGSRQAVTSPEEWDDIAMQNEPQEVHVRS